MKKKLVALLLASCMLSVLLLGCNDPTAETGADATTAGQTTAGETTAGQTDAATTVAVTEEATTDAVTTDAVTTEAAVTEAATTAELETTGEPVTYEVIERNGYVNTFDITDYGAVGDGVTDCTAAVQAALDEAGRVEGTVIVPPGKYVVGQLKMHPRTRLEGDSAWSYHADGGSVFLMKTDETDATCMIDITGAYGCTITGMSLNGMYVGQGIHGVYLNWDWYNGGNEEDTPTIEDCRIGRFSGDGIHLKHIWCFSVRHNMVHMNTGSGLYIDGWDGFILDNWFTGNANCGIKSDPTGAALTITGNRIEWNTVAGIWILNGDILTVTGNFFDRSFGPGLKLGGDNNYTVTGATVTGNFFRRNGSPDRCEFSSEYESSHIYMRWVENVTVTGNSFKSGVNDAYDGTLSPNIDIFVGNSNAVSIQSNVMYDGSVEKCIVNLRNRNTVITGNVTHHEQETWKE